ncbi:MAG: glucose 1-dehydrogenase [Thermoleophilia bacterium]
MEGRVALVTGAAGGIGRAACLGFAARGARVLACDLDAAGAEATAGLVRAAGGEAIARRVDVCDADDVRGMVAAAVEAFGRLDHALNNAGVIGDVGVSLAETDEAVWRRVVDVNLTGVFLCLRAEIPVLAAAGRGSIVNTASALGLTGDAGLGPYVASKHGVVGLTRAAALELATTGVRVNCICPGVTRTGMIEEIVGGDPAVEAAMTSRQPLGRMGTPAEVAAAAVWLCSDEAAFVTGHALAVDGGQLITP